jgi:hypothetical protein
MNDKLRSKLPRSEPTEFGLLNNLSAKLRKPEFKTHCRILIGQDSLSASRIATKPNFALEFKGNSPQSDSNANNNDQRGCSPRGQSARSNFVTKQSTAVIGSLARESLTLRLEDRSSLLRLRQSETQTLVSSRPGCHRVKRDMNFELNHSSIKRIICARIPVSKPEGSDANTSQDKYFGESLQSSQETIKTLKDQLSLASRITLTAPNPPLPHTSSFTKPFKLDSKISKENLQPTPQNESKPSSTLTVLQKLPDSSTLKTTTTQIDDPKNPKDDHSAFKIILQPVKLSSALRTQLLHSRVSQLVSRLPNGNQ